MIDIAAERVCSRSRDLFKFSEISDNISETVQDRDIVAMEV